MSAPTQAEVNRIVAGYDRADGAAGYAASLVINAEQIDGDEYRVIWSTEYTGDFVPDAIAEEE